MVKLNVPETGGTSGPVHVYDLIPLSDITAQQGGLNLYEVGVSGALGVDVDGTACTADLLIQFFSQNSPVGQPFVAILRAGQRRLYKWGSPIDQIIVSNLSGSYPLPLGFSSILGNNRLGQTTRGYVLFAGTDDSLDIEALTPPETQVQLAQLTLGSSSPQTVVVNIDNSINSLELYLDQGANLNRLSIVGVQSGYTYFNEGTPGWVSPQMLSIPILAAFDTQLNVTFTFSVGSWKVGIAGRRDAYDVNISANPGAVITTTQQAGATETVLSKWSDPVIDNATRVTGQGNNWLVSGYDGALNLELHNTNTGGTTTVRPQGSIDGVNWHDVGYYEIVLNGVTQTTLTRTTGNLTLTANTFTVLQLLDPWPIIALNISAMGTGGALTSTGYGVS